MAHIISESDWLETSLGRYVLEREVALYDQAVADIFGFRAVQLGLPQVDLLRHCRIPFCMAASPNGNALRCDYAQLPLASTSLDLILLPHLLEFAENPHQILRDAERTLVPEGHLILSGFNPLSLWGLRHAMYPRRGYPWEGRFITLRRMKDWLALLGLEVVSGHMACYAPPMTADSWLNHLRWMENAGNRWWPMMGGIYFLVARKKVVGMRLIRPQWSTSSLRQAFVPRSQPSRREFHPKIAENTNEQGL